MAMVTTIGEKILLLNIKRDRFNARGQTVWLYTNNHTPTAYDTLSDYAPTTVDGVSGQPVDWDTPAYDVGDGRARMDAVFAEFVPTGTSVVETVRGYFVVDNTSSLLVYAEKFTTPIPNFGATLQPITLVPRYVEADAA